MTTWCRYAHLIKVAQVDTPLGEYARCNGWYCVISVRYWVWDSECAWIFNIGCSDHETLSQRFAFLLLVARSVINLVKLHFVKSFRYISVGVLNNWCLTSSGCGDSMHTLSLVALYIFDLHICVRFAVFSSRLDASELAGLANSRGFVACLYILCCTQKSFDVDSKTKHYWRIWRYGGFDWGMIMGGSICSFLCG